MSQPRDSRGRFTFKLGAGTVLVAGAVAIAAASGTGAGSGSGLGAGSRIGTSIDAPSVSVQARTARGQQRAARTRTTLGPRLEARVTAQSDATSCSDGARGQVRAFLAAHPCESVYRARYTVTDRGVGAVAAVAWVDITGLDDAVALKALVDRPGTGNVDALPPPPGVRVIDLAEPAYASRRDGHTVVTVEVEPTTAGASRAVLERIAEEFARTASQ